MSGFVYIWFDRKHKRYYIGSHWGSPDDGYICSSSWMKQAYKHRRYDFKRRIIQTVTTNRKDLFEAEERWLRMIKPEEIKNRYYNLHLKTKHHWLNDPQKSLSVAKKISKSLTGKKQTEETKKKRVESLRHHHANRTTPWWAKGYKMSEESSRKKSETMKKILQKNPNPHTFKKGILPHNTKTWFIEKDNKIHQVNHLRKFCENNHINYDSLRKGRQINGFRLNKTMVQI